MNWISWVCFGICSWIILSCFRPGADFLSPARVFGFIWSFAIGITVLKFSALQHEWNFDSWMLLLIAVAAFLLGIFIAYVLNLNRKIIPIPVMREVLKREQVRESRLFWSICLSVVVYGAAYIANFLVKGWLPIATVGTAKSRVEFNVTGLTMLIYSVSFIIFFILLYYLKVEGKKNRKVFLSFILLIVMGSFVLFVSRYHIIMVVLICIPLFYYSTKHINLKTGLTLFIGVTAFFYWISSIRLSNVITTYLYTVSKMRFPKAYAMLTEPYMYFAMNLENFARSVNRLEYHTYGYFTFDFVTSLTGMKYWLVEYFNIDRMPFLRSGYNTYTAFWWFYYDYGVIGLALIPWVLGFCTGLLYYRMRSKPGIKNMTAYGVMVFVMFISYFNFPIAFIWFDYILLAMFLILRWTIIPVEEYA
jgi:oligosaccharide repeat unit polymerase